mmetsp:Transcript_31874/g.91840  ORF Transcript_31874/g.91840 Transcript_31874/m.91840 type:complete len:299 (-) Transcript_31874:643-1539(-)
MWMMRPGGTSNSATSLSWPKVRLNRSCEVSLPRDFINQSLAICAALACVSSKTKRSTVKTERREMKSRPRSIDKAQSRVLSANSGFTSGGVPMPKAVVRPIAGGSSGSKSPPPNLPPDRNNIATKTATPAPIECPVHTMRKVGRARSTERMSGMLRSKMVHAARTMPSCATPPQMGAGWAATSVSMARQSTVPRTLSTSHPRSRHNARQNAGSNVRSPQDVSKRSSLGMPVKAANAAEFSAGVHLPKKCAAAPPANALTPSRRPSFIGAPYAAQAKRAAREASERRSAASTNSHGAMG